MSSKMFQRARKRGGWLVLAALAALLTLWACRFSQNDDPEYLLNIKPSVADSLKQFEKVVIVATYPDGHGDTLFQGKVTDAAQLQNLSAPHFPGGKATISITGFTGGQPVYQVDKKIDGKTGKTEGTDTLRLPGSSVRFPQPSLQLPLKTKIDLPSALVTPSSLLDKSVAYTALDPGVVALEQGKLRAVSLGLGRIQARLNSDPSVADTLRVTVVANDHLPESLVLSPDTLKLAAGGRTGFFTAKILPATAAKDVAWRSEDPATATVSAAGEVAGLKQGLTRVFAYGEADSAAADTAYVTVSAPVAVASVRFLADSLELFPGGAAESLLVEVKPDPADARMGFTVLDPAFASVVNGRVSGLKEGLTKVVGASVADPTKTDTLRLIVLSAQKVDKVTVSPAADTLYVGGDSLALTAAVLPKEATQKVIWSSTNPAVASVDGNGLVRPLSQGITQIKAASRVDTAKNAAAAITVQVDVPELTVGPADTTISVGATLAFTPKAKQAFGKITFFEWDLDGDGKMEGSADSLKPVSQKYDSAKTYTALFRVKDTEGNSATATMRIKAVKGPIIAFTAPADNSYSRVTTIDVAWTVDNVAQTTGLKETLTKNGANTVTRTAKDSAGKSYSASITVFLDTTAPSKPLVHGNTPTNAKTPTWTWGTGGGGNGSYRARLDVDDLSAAPEIKDTTFTSPTDLTEGAHTLYVQERDIAGNWSASGRLAVRIDLTAPAAPTVVSPGGVWSTSLRPTWIWKPNGSDGMRKYRYKLDNNALETGATETTDTLLTQPTDLSQATHTLYVQERDTAGNWSPSGPYAVRIDATPPGAPKIDSTPYSPLNTLKPKWTWTSGGAGGIGTYRARLDNATLTSGADTLLAANYAPAANQTQATHTLYVQERDSAGNWSVTSSRPILLSLRDTLDSPSPDRGISPSLAISHGNVPHIAYMDFVSSSASYLYVKKLAGSLWQSLPGGSFFTTANTGKMTVTLAFNPSDTPYVAFSNPDSFYNVGIMKFTGTGWAHVGPKFSIDAGGSPPRLFLDFNPGGTPFLGFHKQGTSGCLVFKFNGSTWDSLGTSSSIPAYGYSFSMAVGANANPIVTYVTSGMKLNAVSWNGSAWAAYGPADFATVSTVYNEMRLTPAGRPAVAFNDGSAGGKVSALINRAGAWTSLGTPNVAPATGYDLGDFTLAKNDVPIIAFTNFSVPGALPMMAFTGGVWAQMGPTSAGIGTMSTVHVQADAAGIPYLEFTDGGNSGKIGVYRGSFDP